MRCEHDTATAELPGIPPAPVKPTRTTQAQRMNRMGYQGPKDRQRCETCLHSCFAADDSNLIRCELGDFPVMRGGLCAEWEALR